ncbi:DUF2642 domain-containing protein [Viridibacillus sp. NPDC096237]|uniref:DUF2642 domain-containing protein n=1 Tax=Viridibacillus sp. NPDC096237 TaxID=3390721 RepID=UPI003D0879E2
MNTTFQDFDNEIVKLDLSGKNHHVGNIVEFGNDLIVLFNGTDYIYIPFEHILNLSIAIDKDHKDAISEPLESPSIASKANKNDLTLTNVLTQAQGMFVEIYVTNNQPLHGYISHIMEDYFVFHSPIYKTMIIATKHLKWLIPYSHNQRPFGLTDHNLSVKPFTKPLLKTIKEQVEKMQNELVVFNLGEKLHHVGKIKNFNGLVVEIETARNVSVFLNLLHIKTIHRV